MSFSPNSELLRRTIDQNYAEKKRTSSLKWIAVNGVFFLLFSFDLWGKCEGYTSPLHYVELCCAGVAAANLLHHALRLARRPGKPPQLRRPFGRDTSRLESSTGSCVGDTSLCSAESSAEEALSLSLGGAWRSSASPSPSLAGAWGSSPSPSLGGAWGSSPSPSPSPPAHPSHAPHSSPLSRYERDEFIADQRSLANYLRQRSGRAQPEGGASVAAAASLPAPASPPVYQLAAQETESCPAEEGAAPQVWRRLQLDPRRLTQFNLNLRLWIHVTILERVVREMAALDAALAAHGLPDVRIGQVSAERLRKTAASGLPALAALLPFLEPFADQRYVAQRYRELANGGCLSEYKWNGGGSEWDESRPTDAELVLHVFATYLDAQLPAEGAPTGPGAPPAGAFSSRHVSAAPEAAPRGPRALAVHRVTRTPPHYVLVRGEETIEVGAGRNNLLHCLLLLLALCAARDPPALQRLHLGPAGLNMLWVVGR